MKNRREFLQAGLAGLMTMKELPIVASSELKTIANWDLPDVNLRGWQVSMRTLTLSSIPSPKHTHPGFVLGYVLDGKFRFQLQGQPEEVLKMGDGFYEPPGVIHLESSSASTIAQTHVLVLSFGEKGKALTKLL